jgi:hypothetical protein
LEKIMPLYPARRDIEAARNVPFGLTWEFLNGASPFNLTGYTGAMQVRLYEGAAGSPLINLVNVATNTEGVRIYGTDGEVQVMINEATLAAMPGQGTPEAGSAQTFHYDLVLTDTAGRQERWLYGTFTLRPGVTD